MPQINNVREITLAIPMLNRSRNNVREPFIGIPMFGRRCDNIKECIFSTILC